MNIRISVSLYCFTVAHLYTLCCLHPKKSMTCIQGKENDALLFSKSSLEVSSVTRSVTKARKHKQKTNAHLNAHSMNESSGR